MSVCVILSKLWNCLQFWMRMRGIVFCDIEQIFVYHVLLSKNQYTASFIDQIFAADVFSLSYLFDLICFAPFDVDFDESRV